MRTSLIVTTYNRPDALHIVLQSIVHQSQLPDEIVIADDGSDDETRKVIANVQNTCKTPLVHAWQEDLGFRAARVRNLAASKARGNYLIFIDGDMILHPRFIASHVKSARSGHMLHGKRAMLTQRMTNRILRNKQYRISPFATGITLRRYAFHIDPLVNIISYFSEDWYDTQLANLSLWKEDLIAVNGFNEDFTGWGREDSELALRLTRNRLRKLELRFCAVAFHLAHGKDNKNKNPASLERNQKLLEHSIESGIIRCENGIDKHF